MFCQYNVKAVVDWKYKTNGDPMADLGYFLMMFLKPKEIKGLKKLTPLLAGQYATHTACSCLYTVQWNVKLIQHSSPVVPLLRDLLSGPHC